MITVRLPPAYGRDAYERLEDPPHDDTELVRVAPRYVALRMSRAAIEDMLSDARYYADPNGPGSGDRDYRGLRQSAAAAVPILKAALESAECRA